jgi:predicted 3-demethylubiquinone-9 3-methyltransferase (glyoxalase superfamily)
MVKQAKNTICLWYDGDAEEAARFYAETFPDSSVGAVHRAPGDFPKRIATGTRSSATAARKVSAAGARTNGDCPGRSRRSP